MVTSALAVPHVVAGCEPASGSVVGGETFMRVILLCKPPLVLGELPPPALGLLMVEIAASAFVAPDPEPLPLPLFSPLVLRKC